MQMNNHVIVMIFTLEYVQSWLVRCSVARISYVVF